MFFLKKKTTATVVDDKNLNIQVIPEEFYGGKNPVIKFKRVEKEIEIHDTKSVITKKEKEALNKSSAVGGSNKWHPANLLTSRKFLIISGLTIFLVFIQNAFYLLNI